MPSVEEIWAWELKGSRNVCSTNVITSFYCIWEPQLWSIADRVGGVAAANWRHVTYHRYYHIPFSCVSFNGGDVGIT